MIYRISFAIVVFGLWKPILGDDFVRGSTPAEIKKMLEERCSKEYSVTCLKLDMASVVPSLSAPRSYKLLPGLSIESGGYKNKLVGKKWPPEDVEPALDMYLHNGLDSFIESLSLRIKIMDRNAVEQVKDIGYRVFNATTSIADQDFSGRGRRRRINHALLIGGMVSAGTLLALTMSAISAMAGKALLASIIALTLTLLGNRGVGANASPPAFNGGGKTTYEIITHAVPHHHDHEYNRHTWGVEPASAQEAYQFVKAIHPNNH